MTRLSNPARASTTPCPRAGLADGSDPDSRAPVGLSPDHFAYRIRAMAAELDRATALFGFAVILFAVLWFATGLPGAPRPGEFVGRSPVHDASDIGASLP